MKNFTCYACNRDAEFEDRHDAAFHDWAFLDIFVGDGVVPFCPNCDPHEWMQNGWYTPNEVREVCYV